MSTLVKVEAAMVGGAVLGFIALALVGRTLQARGTVRDPAALGRMTFPLLIGLFLLFGLGLIGLALHFFVVTQGRIGNADVAPVSFVRRSEVGVTLGVWAFLFLGFAIAYPAMRREMVGAGPPEVGQSSGVLRADVGQTMEQVRSASTLALAKTRQIGLDQSTQTIGEGVFDFEIAGSGVRFEKCRYYFLSTGAKNDPLIDSMNIGISPYKKPIPQIKGDEADIHARLLADGWEPGRFVWRTDRDLMLNGGKPTTGEGKYWGKGGTLIIISSRRMDDAKPGEDPLTAGEFILFLDVVPKGGGSYAKLEFGPAPALVAPGGALP